MNFLIRFDKDGKIQFTKESIRKQAERVKEFYVSSGVYFSVTINDIEKESTTAQHALFHRICFLIANDSGAEFIDIKKELERVCLPVEPTGEKDLFNEPIIEIIPLQQLSIKQFRTFLEKTILIANDMFEMNLEIYSDEMLGTIIKIKNE